MSDKTEEILEQLPDETLAEVKAAEAALSAMDQSECRLKINKLTFWEFLKAEWVEFKSGPNFETPMRAVNRIARRNRVRGGERCFAPINEFRYLIDETFKSGITHVGLTLSTDLAFRVDSSTSNGMQNTANLCEHINGYLRAHLSGGSCPCEGQSDSQRTPEPETSEEQD